MLDDPRTAPPPAPFLGRPDGAPDFAETVSAGGYLWWYLDALSDDGRHGLTVIAFVGSVFSPYYHWSGRGDPENHVAVNIALYGEGGKRWAMTERGRAALDRSTEHLQVGPSRLVWERDGLTLTVNETAIPHFTPIRGTVRVEPGSLNTRRFALDPDRRHHWRPIAPGARVSVRLDNPALSWDGDGYLDSNRGEEPVENGFHGWDWSRAVLPRSGADGGDSIVLYDTRPRSGQPRSMALRFGADGSVSDLAPPPRVALPSTFWRVRRGTQADTSQDVAVRQTLEDAPFYARSLIDTRLFGQRVEAFHESLDTNRLRSPIVRLMLPFRMPRRR